MQQHIYYTKYALQFADMQIPELVTVFNRQVDNTGWTGMRAYHDQALIDEFQQLRPSRCVRYCQQPAGHHRLKAFYSQTPICVCSWQKYWSSELPALFFAI